MKRLWERVLRFFEGVVLISIVFVCLPTLTRQCEAQGKLPPVVVPGSWTTVDLTLPAMSEYSQPFIYESWWREIGACEHVTVPMDLAKRVHFIFVNAPTMIVDMQPNILGFANPSSLTIYIALPFIFTESIVKHEMLHWLDYVNGIDEGLDFHPVSRFGIGRSAVCGITRLYYG